MLMNVVGTFKYTLNKLFLKYQDSPWIKKKMPENKHLVSQALEKHSE